jgi:hypothetical protein
MDLTNRVYELQDQHKWSRKDTSAAIAILDEQLLIQLYNVGTWLRSFTLQTHIHIHMYLHN